MGNISEGEINELVQKSIQEFADSVKRTLHSDNRQNRKLSIEEIENIIDAQLEDASAVFYMCDNDI